MKISQQKLHSRLSGLSLIYSRYRHAFDMIARAPASSMRDLRNIPLIVSHTTLPAAHSPLNYIRTENFRALTSFKLPLFLRNHNRDRSPPSALQPRQLFHGIFGWYVGATHTWKLFQFIYNRTPHEVSLSDEKHNQLENDFARFRRHKSLHDSNRIRAAAFSPTCHSCHFYCMQRKALTAMAVTPATAILHTEYLTVAANNNNVKRLRGAPNACKH